MKKPELYFFLVAQIKGSNGRFIPIPASGALGYTNNRILAEKIWKLLEEHALEGTGDTAIKDDQFLIGSEVEALYKEKLTEWKASQKEDKPVPMGGQVSLKDYLENKDE